MRLEGPPPSALQSTGKADRGRRPPPKARIHGGPRARARLPLKCSRPHLAHANSHPAVYIASSSTSPSWSPSSITASIETPPPPRATPELAILISRIALLSPSSCSLAALASAAAARSLAVSMRATTSSYPSSTATSRAVRPARSVMDRSTPRCPPSRLMLGAASSALAALKWPNCAAMWSGVLRSRAVCGLRSSFHTRSHMSRIVARWRGPSPLRTARWSGVSPR
eukprot:scaffold239149_cov32-Tisochrysis_lutea.AAC.1